jgi:hypothetical protein
MIARRDWVALGAAGTAALALPLILLPPGPAAPRASPRPVTAPLAAPPQPALAAVYSRPLFAAAPAEASEALPEDAPPLIGIVGRLDQDAVALVRTQDGTTRTLRIGESVDGWRLESLAIDAAFFTRGSQRVRVALTEG